MPAWRCCFAGLLVLTVEFWAFVRKVDNSVTEEEDKSFYMLRCKVQAPPVEMNTIEMDMKERS